MAAIPEHDTVPLPPNPELPATEQNLILGIDLGTTTVKICLIHSGTKSIVFEKSRKTNADISNVHVIYTKAIQVKNFDGFSEQDVRKIWSTINELLQEMDPLLAGRIKAVGLCGQQHGVMLWNEESCRNFIKLSQDIPQSCLISNLITWQDQRCTQEFLESLPKPDPEEQVISTGYGACSLFWLARNAPNLLENYDQSGTIMDFVASLIVKHVRHSMSPHNAESWGYFDRFNNTWNTEILNASGFPVNLLPDLLVGNKSPFVGALRSDPEGWHGITGDSVPVGVAMGDLQCSFLASVQNDNDAVLNFSTSSQISFIRTRVDLPVPVACDVRTYFGQTGEGRECHAGRELIVAPSLNGGNVLTFFVETLANWMDGLITKEEIWSKMIPLANAKDWNTTTTKANDVSVKPTLFGERYATELRASVGNLSVVNCDLGSVVMGIVKGVVENLNVMLSGDYLRQSGVNRIVLTGSVFKTFPQLGEYVSHVFGMPVVDKKDEEKDAAYGAALATLIRVL